MNNKKLNLQIFIFFIIYVSFAGLILQNYIIPNTPWHAGNGLLTSGDWLLFHQLALEHVSQIESNGWRVFDWRPGGQGPSGFAATIYALTGIYVPWVLLPLHGVVYALAAIGLFEVMKKISGSTRVGLLALTPLLFMPSLAMVWGQIHKDIWVMSAILLLMAYWTSLFLEKNYSWWTGIILLIYVNACMVWMRPYVLQISLVGQILLFAMLLMLKIRRKNYLIIFLGVLSIVATLCSWNFTKIVSDAEPPSTTVAASTANVVNTTSVACKAWTYTLPIKWLDNTLMSLACTRDVFNNYLPNAGSNLDSNVEFNSAIDVFFYIPRALQITIFAPFPDMWFARGSSGASSVFRLVAAIETLVMYFGLLGIFLAQVLIILKKIKLDHAKNTAILGVVFFGVIWVMVYALTTGNVGGIYRMRFPIMLLWIGLGLLGWREVVFWFKLKVLNAHS